MTKNKNKILNQKAPFLFVVLLAFVLLMANFVLLENHIEDSWVLGVSKKAVEKTSFGQVKKLENVSPASIKAKSHVEKVKNVVDTLENISYEEESVGNNEVSEEISNAVEGIESVAVDVVGDIEEIDERPAWKKFLLGPDYKNLGELRSNLVHTENNIRKITRTTTRVEGAQSDEALQQQIGDLNHERERIMSIIKEEEESFSLLGWAFKLLAGYDTQEKELLEIVEEPTSEPTNIID
jgi:hypothetical protein